MPASKREGALLEMRRRLQQIRIANDFLTDAGETVLIGEDPVFGPDDPPMAIAVMVGGGADAVRGMSGTLDCRVPISVQAFIRADAADEPMLAIEAVLADIKRAVELEDRSLDGWCLPTGLMRTGTRSLERAPGSEFVGAAVDYEAQFEEGWGKP